MTRKVIFIRHGQSMGNVDHSFYDEPDSAICLTSVGVKQALECGKQIKEKLDSGFFKWDTREVHAYVSDYTRAKQTARIVLDKAGLRHVNPIMTRALNERRYDFQNDHDDNLKETNPYWRPGPEGETMLECQSRFTNWFFRDVYHLLTDSDAVLFMHSEAMKCAISGLMGWSPVDMMQLKIKHATPIILHRVDFYDGFVLDKSNTFDDLTKEKT